MATGYILLLAALTAPFWILGAAVQAEPLPGLPLSGLMAFCPTLAAAILVGRAKGAAGLRAFLARAFDGGRMRGRLGWAAVIVLMPATELVSLAVGPRAAPLAPFPLWAPVAMLAAFFVAGLGEELGWSGYLLEPLERRWGELAAALVLGVVWAAWHIVPFLQADRSWDWIAWQCAKTVAVRVVMVRLYFGAGRSVFAVTVFHALDNVAAFSLPMLGAAYEPAFTTAAVTAVAIALHVVRRTP